MKEEKSKRGRKGYPLDFKWRVIDDLLATGESIATMYADEYGNGVVGAWNRKGKGRTLKPGP